MSTPSFTHSFFEIFRSQKPSAVGFSDRVLQRFCMSLRFSIALRDDHVLPKKQLRTCHSSGKKLKFMGTGLDHVGLPEDFIGFWIMIINQGI